MHTHYRVKNALLAATALSIGLATPAWAQNADDDNRSASSNDIIVTAQRIEQRLQDVPISITVLSEDALTNNNVTSARDIATYTPGLTTNNRYGGDNTTWTIRGFTQEQRTTSTVGTYFADVVALRGSGATQGADGAGPGQLFDLQNVQVLKGPQGTLFGRNSTGGAVLLVPKKPTDRFEGYVEGSVGDYGMYRAQAVINVPVMETLRVRLGVDRYVRDGYVKNVGLIGTGPNGNDANAMGSSDNWAFRFSAIADLSPDVENYTIASYSRTRSTGLGPKVIKCWPQIPGTSINTSFGTAACAQIAREAPHGFWSVSNSMPNNQSNTDQWQVINTTTWQASDNLVVKNIFSYGEFRGKTNLDLFGIYIPIVTSGTETSGAQVRPFNTTTALPGHYTNAQSSLVEELQVQGNSADGRLIWQGGLYLEKNDPIGLSGIVSTTLTPCAEIETFNCVPLTNGATSLGRLGYQSTRNYFEGKAVYFQTSYDLTDQLKVTGGIRYTWDRMRSQFQVVGLTITTNPPGNNAVCTNNPTFGNPGSATNPRRPIGDRFDMCWQDHEVKSSAPTWVLGLDFKPVEDVLLYAKWSRGYRQGGVASFGADRLQDYGEETVDTYEIGAKTSWRGMIPGFFNVSAFYNDFRDQQLQIGLQCNPVSACSQTTAIINAGKSRLQGFEIEAGVSPFDGFNLTASYAYLDTKVIDVLNVAPLVAAAGLPFNDIRPISVGSPIPNAMPHKLILGANLALPLPESIGKITLGGTFVYQSEYRAVTDGITGSNLGVLPGVKYGNINVNWEGVAGLPIDASFFMTNVTNEEILMHVNEQQTSGFDSYFIGEPRMYGFRLRYNF